MHRYLPSRRSLVQEHLQIRQFYRYTTDLYLYFYRTDIQLQPPLPPQKPPQHPIEVETVSTGVKAAPKASKSKRKQKAAAVRDPVSDNEVPAPVKPKRGRPSGSGNYDDDETVALLKFVEMELPIGMHGWQAVYSKFRKWARDHQRAERDAKSVETKFKQVGACNPAPTSLTTLLACEDHKAHRKWCPPTACDRSPQDR
jgi:hypothetical protein